MAKQKEVDELTAEFQQKIAQLQSQLDQAKQQAIDAELKVETLKATDEKVFELVFSCLQVCTKFAPGTAGQIERLLPVLEERVGKERYEELYLAFYGLKKSK